MLFVGRIQDYAQAADSGVLPDALKKGAGYNKSTELYPEQNDKFHAVSTAFFLAQRATSGEDRVEVRDALLEIDLFKPLQELLDEGYEMEAALNICHLVAVRKVEMEEWRALDEEINTNTKMYTALSQEKSQTSKTAEALDVYADKATRAMFRLEQSIAGYHKMVQQKNLVSEVTDYIFKHPNTFFTRKPLKNGGVRLQLYPRFVTECACTPPYDRSVLGNEREAIDDRVVTYLKDKHPPKATEELHCTSVGAGAGLDDVMRLQKIVKAGYRAIVLTRVEPESYVPPQERTIRGEIQLLATSAGASIISRVCKDITEVPQGSQHVIWAVDADFVTKLRERYTYLTSLRGLLREEGLLEHSHHGHSVSYTDERAILRAVGPEYESNISGMEQLLNRDTRPYPKMMDVLVQRSTIGIQYEIIRYLQALHVKKGVQEINLQIISGSFGPDEKLRKQVVAFITPFLPEGLKCTVTVTGRRAAKKADQIFIPFCLDAKNLARQQKYVLVFLKEGGTAIFGLTPEDERASRTWITDRDGRVLDEEIPEFREGVAVEGGGAGGGGSGESGGSFGESYG
ncbi:MAG: hypothetical protein SP1CHLAM54_17970 [Chlamydiia bacterium]|nr:hypothetical protein [Chlamydiia bacterium]MCH9616684.1 hypothetical protein [Chlamydiia bacterium]MCH9629415.1 hypothetical protein [Chlamydiia bacterium]